MANVFHWALFAVLLLAVAGSVSAGDGTITAEVSYGSVIVTNLNASVATRDTRCGLYFMGEALTDEEKFINNMADSGHPAVDAVDESAKVQNPWVDIVLYGMTLDNTYQVKCYWDENGEPSWSNLVVDLEPVDPCLQDRCNLHGTCEPASHTVEQFKCSCEANWTGTNDCSVERTGATVHLDGESPVVVADGDVFMENDEGILALLAEIEELKILLADLECSDGLQNEDEDGVDCGGWCLNLDVPQACPQCDDGTQNGDESGVDCGGTCEQCPQCDDGLQNGDESGVDCGGTCAQCPS